MKTNLDSSTLTGIFVVDLKGLKLTQAQLAAIDSAIQNTVQSELAKLDDTEGVMGGPLGGGIVGFRAE
jgi:hypothetical protein